MDNSISNASTELPDICWSLSSSYHRRRVEAEAEKVDQSESELAEELLLNDTANISLYSLDDYDLSEHSDDSSDHSIDREHGPPAFNIIAHEPYNFTQAVNMLLDESDGELPDIRPFGPEISAELVERAASIIKTDNDPGTECAVCLLSETDCILTCGHQFHYEGCIIPWFFLHNHDSCPFCRQKI